MTAQPSAKSPNSSGSKWRVAYILLLMLGSPLLITKLGQPWWIAFPGFWIIVALFVDVLFKRRLIKVYSRDVFVVAVSPVAFPTLDSATLERQTHELLDLGFVQLGDIASGQAKHDQPPLPEATPSSPRAEPTPRAEQFIRVLAHPPHHCYACIEQIFVRGGDRLAMQCILSSELEEGWRFATTTGPPRRSSYLSRLPRTIGQRYPDMPLAELFRLHLQEREKIMADLRITVHQEESLQNYVAILQRNRMEVRQSIRRQRGLQLFWGIIAASFNGNKDKMEWLGDYARIKNSLS